MKFFLIFSFLAIAFFGCKSTQNDASKRQIIKINIQGDPASLHPFLGVDFNCRCLQNALFEGLTRINGDGEAELAAAEAIEISKDQLRYTFRLRELKWSNGEEVKASHFVDSWKRGISKNSPCLRADLFYVIKNAKSAKKGDVPLDAVGISAPDDKTIVVELIHPTPYFLDLTANPLFSPLYDNSETPTVFNGPFTLKHWEHEKVLILESNPYYWDQDHVALKEIIVAMVKDPNTALLMFEKGEIDWIGNPFTLLPLDAIPHLQKFGKIHTKKISGVYWLSCNTKEHYLSSIKIRKALSYALNRKLIAETVLHGETPCQSVTPPFSLFDEEELHFDGDIAQAQKLFDEGLKELNLTKETFPKIGLSHSDVPGQKSLMEAIAREWEKTLGIKVELSGSEWNVFSDNLGTRQFEIGGCISYFLYNDPLYALDFFKEISHRHNSSSWENKEYQKLLDQAVVEIDLNKRKEYLKKAETILLDEMPVIPLYVVNNKYMLNERVKNVYISDLGHVDFKWTYIQ